MSSTLLFKIRFWLFVGLFVATASLNAQTDLSGDGAKGFNLFDKNCKTCHQLDSKLIGPALRGVTTRLQEEQGLGREWLQKWIKNNVALRESGDAYANQVFQENAGQVMNQFESFSEQDIDDILVYLEDPEAGEAAWKKKIEEEEAAAAAAKQTNNSGSGGVNTGVVILGFIVLASLLAWILLRMNTLVRLTQAQELTPEIKEQSQSFVETFEKYKKFAGLVMGVLTFLALYGLWNFLLGIGVDKGYEPEQPIYFSHKVHNGLQGIDCQYCHSSAKYGKVSGIPSANLCMNCHKNINEYKGESLESKEYLSELVDAGFKSSTKEIKEYYTAEIHKMYKAIGWDPEKLEYTGEQKPIKWTRIHNMPDFVYFPHSQHVVVGEQAIKDAMEKGTIPNHKELDVKGSDPVCYACHGQVGEMDEVKMANKFTMGWCIECHRTTEVDMSNEYNKAYYEGLHEKLKAEYGEGTKITIDAIGGLECGKCHY